ncbi:MAG: long-chain fatty acid--CoA ligase [Thermoleophilia bacterium]|nr:long-chain fatty acid--CoA ligase [Thermoleophilia bacterium]
MGTIAGLWREAVAAEHAGPAYLVQTGEGWQPVSWAGAGRAVEEVAAGLLALGVEPGDRVALLSRTRLEWLLSDLALASIGAVSVPIYPTSSAVECAYVLGNAGATAVVCENPEQYAKIAPLRAELEALERVVVFDGAPGSAVTLAELRERGRAALERDADAVLGASARVADGDLLTIIYTSGTTGPPKGCVLTHRHYRTMTDVVTAVPGLFESGDRVLLYLPLAHNFARLVGYLGAGAGFTLAFCPEVSDVPKALLDVRPTILPTVPRLLEKAYATIQSSVGEMAGAKGRLARWALDTGRQASRARQRGSRLPPALAARLAVADRLVLRKVRARFGGELRLAVSGGAPLAAEVAELFHAVGIPVLEGYGLTECTTASHMNVPGSYRFGTVGLPLGGIEARLAGDGEVLLRGETVFAGYWQDEKATREAVTADGWLLTGDVGSLDEDGFLTIVDRKKDIIITAGGKNVSPQNIENALKAAPLVSQALVIGDRRPYLAALLTIDPDEAARVAATGTEARVVVEQAVAEVNRHLGRVEQVKRFAILDRDFLRELGELTPTLKLRRRVCEEHFRDVIETLYAAEDTV